MQVKSVRDADVQGKRVLVRVDFNVPVKDGQILDDNRIRAALPTINFLIEQGAQQIIILTHLGRPGGKVTTEDSLTPVEAHLKTLVSSDRISFFQNLRFDAGEEGNSPEYAAKIAALGDIYVNDAFAASHRSHASIVGVPKLLPSYAGLLMDLEVKNLSEALMPPRPALALIAGAKFETKMPLVKRLLQNYDHVALGGALANDIFKSRGIDVKMSVVSSVAVPEEILNEPRVLAPSDYVWVNDMIVDVGEETREAWAKLMTEQQFVLWNGPVGLYEEGNSAGTDYLAQALASSGVRAIIGGGNTAIALSKVTFDPNKVFISTGGGAMLEFLINGTLPGLEALKQ